MSAQPYREAADTLLRETGCTVRKWRKRNTGKAYVRADDWGIEVPEPRGAISFATFAHEVGHQLLHREPPRLPRWLEELEAWEYALAQFERFSLDGMERAQAARLRGCESEPELLARDGAGDPRPLLSPLPEDTAPLAVLPVTERARMMRELTELDRADVKDKRYQDTPIGREVKRFLRDFRWRDARPLSVEAYESVLSRFSLDWADVDIQHFESGEGPELLAFWLDSRWGESSRNTRGRNTAIVRSFFKWAEDDGLVAVDPARKLRGPRARTHERRAYDQSTLHRLIAAQDSRRDQCALSLLCRMGLRKNELRLLKVGDVDLVRDLITVQGKGDKIAVLPLAFATLRDDLTLHFLEDERSPDEYLLYPRAHRQRPMDQASVHRWFKRCLEIARLPESIKMHELRHSAADHLWRATGNIVLAQQLLRHESVGTTQTYLHPTREDLAAGMREVEAVWVGR